MSELEHGASHAVGCLSAMLWAYVCHCVTDNDIRAEGVASLSEALTYCSELKKLHLSCEWLLLVCG